MFRRLAFWAIARYFGGPAKSWLYTTAALQSWRLVKRVTGRRPVVERLPIGKGGMIIVEHLPISHQRQIRDVRQEKRAQRRAARRARRAARLAAAAETT